MLPRWVRSALSDTQLKANHQARGCGKVPFKHEPCLQTSNELACAKAGGCAVLSGPFLKLARTSLETPLVLAAYTGLLQSDPLPLVYCQDKVLCKHGVLSIMRAVTRTGASTARNMLIEGQIPCHMSTAIGSKSVWFAYGV